MNTASKIAVLIVAAGRGHRAGGGLPKQYRPMPDGRGDSVLARSISAFAADERISDICVSINNADLSLYKLSVTELKLNINIFLCDGGETRQNSVQNGLNALSEITDTPDFVLIHDAARPYVSQRIIDDCIAALATHDGAIPALPVTDTLKRSADGKITETVSRDDLYRAQTPQAFRFEAIKNAHLSAPDNLTDDAAVAEAAGLNVALVDGDASNIKLTFEEDFMPAHTTNGLLHPRTGAGFDVHRFDKAGSAHEIMLGGVAVPHDCALIGHSDADAALHAITDALLGALAEGDIGDHFPPSDARHKDRPSSDFLTFAVDLAQQKQAQLTHIDLTIICEQPKIGPHRDKMRQKIAELCRLPVSAVAVKATTTEGLGFTGRGEGLAAQAMASVLMPAPNEDGNA